MALAPDLTTREQAKFVDDADLGTVVKTLSKMFGSVAVLRPSVVDFYNVTATLAATEYSQALPANTKALRLQARDNGKLQVAFVSGETATKFYSLPVGASLEIENINFTGTVYFRSSKAGEIVEIVTWSGAA